MVIKEIRLPKELMDLYFRFCSRPYESVFFSDVECSHGFLKQLGRENVDDNLHWDEVLIDAIDETLWDYYDQHYLESKFKGRDAAAFSFSYPIDGGGVSGHDIEIAVTNDEDPPEVLNKFMRHFEFLTGIEANRNRLVFFDTSVSNLLTKDEEIVLCALKNRVGVKVAPRPWQPSNNNWRCFDGVVPMIMREISQEEGFFPLNYRYRIWTIIWETAQIVKRLIEVNPDLLERAQSLGVDSDIFNDVLNAQIPDNPATEPIPLEALESVLLLRALIAHMHDHQLIGNDAGYRLKAVAAWLWSD